MKERLYLLIFVFLMLGCTFNKKPVFLKIDNVQIIQYSSDTIKIQAKAFFENPNNVGGKITTDDIAVFVNNNKIARVSSKETKVPAKNEFNIPLLVEIPTKELWEKNKNGLLGSLFNTFINKSFKIQFKGNLTYSVFGFSKTYPVDSIEEIKF